MGEGVLLVMLCCPYSQPLRPQVITISVAGIYPGYEIVTYQQPTSYFSSLPNNPPSPVAIRISAPWPQYRFLGWYLVSANESKHGVPVSTTRKIRIKY